MKLKEKTCIPCMGGVPPLENQQKKDLIGQLHGDWQLTCEQKRLQRTLKLKDYKEAWDLVNSISEVAEQQWHHPDLKFGHGYLEVEIWTHKIDNLVESDFIFAAKVDDLVATYLADRA